MDKSITEFTNLIKDTFRRIEYAKGENYGINGVPSGFADLDRITLGFQQSELYIMAARPGMGKTSLSLSIIHNAAVNFNKSIVLFSLESSAETITRRLITLETGITNQKLKLGALELEEWLLLNGTNKLAEAAITIDDSSYLKINDIRDKLLELTESRSIDLVVIDYLQLLVPEEAYKGNREQEISSIARSLKNLSKELSIPIIAVSQLSRAVESRGDKRPILSDLRDSGALEDHADMVMFIYRPEYYGITEDAEGNYCGGMAEVIVAKHRHGALKNVPLRFIDRLAKFTDLDPNLSLAGGDNAPYDVSKGLDASTDYTPNTKTFKSKMDDNHNIEEDPF
jgi:replicative DNA helicase